VVTISSGDRLRVQSDLMFSRDHYSYIFNGQRLYVWSGEVSICLIAMYWSNQTLRCIIGELRFQKCGLTYFKRSKLLGIFKKSFSVVEMELTVVVSTQSVSMETGVRSFCTSHLFIFLTASRLSQRQRWCIRL